MVFFIICLCLFLLRGLSWPNRAVRPRIEISFLGILLNASTENRTTGLLSISKMQKKCHHFRIYSFAQVSRAIRLLSHFNSASTRFKLNFNINYRDKSVTINIGYGMGWTLCVWCSVFFRLFTFFLFLHLSES